MNKIAIVTDSTSDIPDELIKEYGIKVVPLYIHADGMEYKDKQNITNKEIYEMLYRDVSVKTSAPSPQDFLMIYKDIIENQKIDTIFSINIGSKLSTTINSARIAKSNFPQTDIEIIDSKTVTGSLGLIVLEAARLIKKGIDKQNIKEVIKKLTDKNFFMATVENFKYIFRSGRVPGLKKLLNIVLKIKPIIIIENGKIKVSKITRTRRSSIDALINGFKEKYSNKGKVRAAIFYGNDLDSVQYINQQLKNDSTLNIDEIILTEITPVIGTHTGPSVIGVAAVPVLY
jgi:DegV family protein with EDD domain